MSKVNQIDNGIYEGYLWYSDKQEPELLENQSFECKLEDAMNPFIIEAQLYDRTAKVSYSVKYVDGRYIAFKYENVEETTAATDAVEIEKKIFCANRMGNKKLVFLQWWREKPDAMCEGMNVLQPAELVFVGFKEGGCI